MNDTTSTTDTTRKQARPPVRVHGMTIGFPQGQEPSEWFACCTEAVWVPGADGEYEQKSCNWYGATRTDRRDAESDAARHRRAHRTSYPDAVSA